MSPSCKYKLHDTVFTLDPIVSKVIWTNQISVISRKQNRKLHLCVGNQNMITSPVAASCYSTSMPTAKFVIMTCNKSHRATTEEMSFFTSCHVFSLNILVTLWLQRNGFWVYLKLYIVTGWPIRKQPYTIASRRSLSVPVAREILKTCSNINKTMFKG